jgi:hypothetical protein
MKIKLKYINGLRQELNGISHPETGQVYYRGLLTQELHFKTKYHLTKLSKEVENESELLIESIKQLLEKHFGKDQPKTDQELLERKESEGYLKEVKELYEEEVDFTDYNFSVDDFDFKSNEPYVVFADLFLK